MIRVVYENRLGNNLFQYCFGRILAEELGLHLEAPHIEVFPNTCDLVEGLKLDDSQIETVGCCAELGGMNEESVDLKKIIEDPDSKRKAFLVSGFFQRYEHFSQYKDRIKKWLRQDEEKNFYDIGKDDLVVNIRLGDYVGIHYDEDVYYPRMKQTRRRGHLVDYSYYSDVIKISMPKRVFIVTEETENEIVKKLKGLIGDKCVVVSQSPVEDFKFIKMFNKICMSKSTFCWWAAFLSKAEEIYMPNTNWGVWSTDNTSLFVTDESRYKIIDCSNLLEDPIL